MLGSDLQLQALRLEKEELQEQFDELQVEHSSLASENVTTFLATIRSY